MCLQDGSVSNKLLSNSDSSSRGKAIDAYPNHKRMPLDELRKPAGLPSQAFDPYPPGGMLAFALWRRLLPREMLVRINRATRGPLSVYKRVMPNGGHQTLHAKKPCSARALKPEAQTCPMQGSSVGPNPRCGLLLPPKRPMASTAASSTWGTRTSTGAGAMRRRSPTWPCGLLPLFLACRGP